MIPEFLRSLSNLFFGHSIMTTRLEVQNVFNYLSLLLVFSITQYIIMLIAIKVLIRQKNKVREKTTELNVYLTVSALVCELAIFVIVPTLTLIIFLLATMEDSVQLNDYRIIILLMYLFSALVSFFILLMTGQNYYHKNYESNKKYKYLKYNDLLMFTFKHFTRLVSIIYLLSCLLIYLLLPDVFRGFILVYIATSLFVNLVGGLFVTHHLRSKKPTEEYLKKRRQSFKKKFRTAEIKPISSSLNSRQLKKYIKKNNNKDINELEINKIKIVTGGEDYQESQCKIIFIIQNKRLLIKASRSFISQSSFDSFVKELKKEIRQK